MQVQTKKDTFYETDGMTADQLQNVYNELCDEINSIKSQLDAAKVRRFTTNEYSDPVWFSKAKTALRKMNTSELRLRQMLAIRRKEENKKQSLGENVRFERVFYTVAKNLLSPDKFEQVRVTALRELGNMGE